MHDKDELPEELKNIIGSEVELGWGPDMVCKPTIRYWCEALEDGNPLYYDEEFAKDNGYAGVIAPPTMTPVFVRPALWPPQPEGARIADKIRDFPEVVVQQNEWEFHSPILIGDHLRSVERLVNISPAKKTRLGTGHFVTIQQLYYDQHDRLVATRTSPRFHYKKDSPRKEQTE
ncbi:MaoC family dehydratase N-terminal domain-containing protein [Chloroflexota bacterium]